MKALRTRKGIYYTLKRKLWGEGEKQREKESETVLKKGNLVTLLITSVELKLVFNVSQRKMRWALSKQQEGLNLPHI